MLRKEKAVRSSKIITIVLGLLTSVILSTRDVTAGSVRINAPMPPPNWALLERALLDAHTPACVEFFERYFDERGYLRCVEAGAVMMVRMTLRRTSIVGPSSTHSAATTPS